MKAIKNCHRRQGHYIIIKRSLHQEGITRINIYAPSIRASKHTKQTLTGMNGEIGSNTIIVDFRTPLSIIDEQADH